LIDPAYVRMMARYNAWQNKQLLVALDVMNTEDLPKDRGAFFGSVQSTLNHLLWGDMLWLNRFDPSAPAPDGDPTDSPSLFASFADWRVERLLTDGRISAWANTVTQADLEADLTMFSRAVQAETTARMAMCVPHFFNHQTHHRGQIHAMLTAAGYEAPVSDLFFMPEDN
jgi:uncharacterized damage-inducible protein DinB